jgi:hypothetical protein
MDATVWEYEIARIAAGRGLQAVTDLPIDMWSRILGELDQLDDAATSVVQSFYKVLHNGTISIFITEENRRHLVLLASGVHYTDTQRKLAPSALLQHRPEVQRVLRIFDGKHPNVATCPSMITCWNRNPT